MTLREILVETRSNVCDTKYGYTITQAKSAIRELLLQNLPVNPYPETIFIEPTKEQYEELHKLLQKVGLTLDKYSGAIGRMIYKIIISKMYRAIMEVTK